jgi:Flp pilus assembly protein TadB
MEPRATQPPPADPSGEDLPDLLPEAGAQRGMVARAALLVAALLCFVLGVVFWLVPVMTGIPFWILGLVLLGMASRTAARWVNRHERRLPRRARLLLRPKLRRAGGEGRQRT